MSYQGILFDLDGTLVDSRQDIALSVNATLSLLGIPELPIEKIYNFIGNGISVLMERSLIEVMGEEPSRLLEIGVEMFKNHYGKHLLDNTRCYPDVLETLSTLNDLQKGVISNKIKKFTLEILKGLEILSHFTVVLGGDDVSNKKPHPESILKALDIMKLLPEEVIIVGDNYTDIESGMEAGLTTCFVTYGIGQLKEIKPHFTINSLSELKTIIF